MEYRERAAAALQGAAEAAGVTLPQRTRRAKRKQPEAQEESSQEDDGGLLALAEAGSRETPSPRAFGASGLRSQRPALEQKSQSGSGSQQSMPAGHAVLEAAQKYAEQQREVHHTPARPSNDLFRCPAHGN